MSFSLLHGTLEEEEGEELVESADSPLALLDDLPLPIHQLADMAAVSMYLPVHQLDGRA